MRILFATLLVAAAAAVPAAADPPADSRQMHADDCARARAANRTCVLDMGKEEVDGTSPTAAGTASTLIRFSTESSLIQVRRDFIEQIVRSAESL